MANEDIKCPFCGKLTLEPFDEVGGGWLKCSNCGATHHPNPTVPGQLGVGSTYIGPDGFSHYAPSPIRKRT